MFLVDKFQQAFRSSIKFFRLNFNLCSSSTVCKMSVDSLASPFKCPLTTCDELISQSLLLSHFMKIHQHDEDSVDFKEVQEKEKISMMVSVTGEYLELDKNICLGILAYKMDLISHSNALLSRSQEEFEAHLPILIMASRGNYVKMFEDDADFIDPDADFLAIWLTMPETKSKQNLNATLTVHNEEYSKSISKLVQVRCASSSQDVCEFMHQETDFLITNAAFLKELTTNGSILIEISVIENLL